MIAGGPLVIDASNGRLPAEYDGTELREQARRAMTAVALTTEDIAAIQLAARKAVAGRFLTERLVRLTSNEEAMPAPFRAGKDYLFDEGARIRFTRVMDRDSAFPDAEVESILEVTDLPAVRCADRTASPGARLGFHYQREQTGWRVLAASRIADSEAASLLSPTAMLFRSAALLSDAGLKTREGRAVRGLRFEQQGSAHTVWIDVDSLLLVELTWAFAIDGVHGEMTLDWQYPSGRSIARPEGLHVPDCI